jgi:DnaK suppressor protein
MLDPKFIAEIKTRLETEKTEVEKKINDLTRPEETQDNPNVDDIAQNAADDILEDSLLSVYKNILEKINDALGRITDGIYGRCMECGKEINQEDLRKEPWAEQCRVCKK